MTIKHPPLAHGETFVANRPAADGMPDYLAGLRTARLAMPAYDIEGRPLPDHRALIIGASDAAAYDRIMMARFRAIRGWSD